MFLLEYDGAVSYTCMYILQVRYDTETGIFHYLLCIRNGYIIHNYIYTQYIVHSTQ